MDFNQVPPQKQEDNFTLTVKKSSRNVLFAKVLILLALSITGGYFFAKNGAQRYEKGRELTQEQYLEGFDEYKGALLNAKQFDNLPFSIFVMLMVMSFLIGSYELTALIIGFMIGKVIK